MVTISLTQARAQLSDVVDQARVRQEPVYLTRRDRPVAAVIDSDRLARLLALEAERTGTPVAAESEADRLRSFEELAARAAMHIKPGTLPLLDASDFYQRREPRL